MPQYTITLEYQGKQHSFLDTSNYEGWDADRNADYQVTYMYTEGNYDCDCNRSLFLVRECNVDFADHPNKVMDEDFLDGDMYFLGCGDTIKLISIKDGERVVWPEPQPTWQQAASGLWVPTVRQSA